MSYQEVGEHIRHRARPCSALIQCRDTLSHARLGHCAGPRGTTINSAPLPSGCSQAAAHNSRSSSYPGAQDCEINCLVLSKELIQTYLNILFTYFGQNTSFALQSVPNLTLLQRLPECAPCSHRPSSLPQSLATAFLCIQNVTYRFT